jgi:hypothetical protein
LAKALEVTPDELFAQAGKMIPIGKTNCGTRCSGENGGVSAYRQRTSQERLDMYQRMIDAAEGNAPKPDKGKKMQENMTNGIGCQTNSYEELPTGVTFSICRNTLSRAFRACISGKK